MSDAKTRWKGDLCWYLRRDCLRCTVIRLSFAMYCATLVVGTTTVAEERAGADFRSVLELAELDAAVLGQISQGATLTDSDWRIVIRLLHRLRQYDSQQLQLWIQPTADGQLWLGDQDPPLGALLNIRAVAESFEQVSLPEELAELHSLPAMYRCRIRLAGSQVRADVLVPQVPRDWQADQPIDEPVGLLGVLIRADSQQERGSTLLLTNHLAWYPTQSATRGKLLLARQEMDVALLDDVRQRRPFVKPEISREGEAFYATLEALAKFDPTELTRLARQTVAEASDRWQPVLEESLKKQRQLKTELAAAVTQSRKSLVEQVAKAQQRSALAVEVMRRAEQGLSSVAPLFLQPAEEVGSLVLIAGTARRAVKIRANADRGAGADYFELEIFASDSQNLPIVCCVSRLPPGFPEGDKIREPVQLAGVFFKSWLYRSRKLSDQPSAQQRDYAPIVIGHSPAWIREGVQQKNWGMWGGVAFLALLAIMWIGILRSGHRDRLSHVPRKMRQPAELTVSRGKMAPENDDTNEDRTS